MVTTTIMEMNIKMRKEKYLELKKYIEELKVISIKEKNNDPTFITSIPYSITLNNGRTIEREKIMKGNKNGSAVIIMPITLENEILTVIEPRVFTEKKLQYLFQLVILKMEKILIWQHLGN